MPADLPQQPGYFSPAEFVTHRDLEVGRPFFAAVPEKYGFQPAPAWLQDVLSRAGIPIPPLLGGKYAWRWHLDTDGRVWGGYGDPSSAATVGGLPPQAALQLLAGDAAPPPHPLAGLATRPPTVGHPLAGLWQPR